MRARLASGALLAFAALACTDPTGGAREPAVPPGLYRLVSAVRPPYGGQFIIGAQLAFYPRRHYRVAEHLAGRGAGYLFKLTDDLEYRSTRDGTVKLPLTLSYWSGTGRLTIRGDTLSVLLDGPYGETTRATYVKISDAYERAEIDTIVLTRPDTTLRIAGDTAVDVRGMVRFVIDRNGAYWPAGTFSVLPPEGWEASGTVLRPDGREGTFPLVLSLGTSAAPVVKVNTITAPITPTVTVVRDLSRREWRVSYACHGVTHQGVALDSLVVDDAPAHIVYYQYSDRPEGMEVRVSGTARRHRRDGVVDTVAYTGGTAPWGRQRLDTLDLWGTYHPIPGAAADKAVVTSRTPLRYEGGAYCGSGTGYRPGVLEAVP